MEERELNEKDADYEILKTALFNFHTKQGTLEMMKIAQIILLATASTLKRADGLSEAEAKEFFGSFIDETIEKFIGSKEVIAKSMEEIYSGGVNNG